MFDGIEASNQFKITKAFSLNEEQKTSLRRWLNLEYTGKSQVPFDNTISNELLEAHYRMNLSQNVTVDFTLDKNGNWKIQSVKFQGRKYMIEEVE